MDNKIVRTARRRIYGTDSRYLDLQFPPEIGSSRWLLGQIVFTHQSLRLWIGTIALLYPFVLMLMGSGFNLPIPPSISEYYWHPYSYLESAGSNAYWVGDAPVRVFFVGGLYAIGFFLIGYRGYSRGENILHTLAGMCALGVATFPMTPCDKKDNVCAILGLGNGFYGFPALHGAFALGLFFFLALAIFIYSDITLRRLGNATLERWFRGLYFGLAVSILVMPLIAYAAIEGYVALLFPELKFKHTVYVIEILAIVPFALFWLVKTAETSLSEYDRQLALGLEFSQPQPLATVHQGGTDDFRPGLG